VDRPSSLNFSVLGRVPLLVDLELTVGLPSHSLGINLHYNVDDQTLPETRSTHEENDSKV